MIRKTLHNAADAAADGTIVNLSGIYSLATVQIAGSTYSGTVTFYGRQADDTNWIELEGWPVNDSSSKATSTTDPTNEAWLVPVDGQWHFKAAITRTAGTVTVTATFTH